MGGHTEICKGGGGGGVICDVSHFVAFARNE